MASGISSRTTSTASEGGLRLTTAFLVISLAGLAILPYLNALHAGLVFDDRYLASTHPVIKGAFSLARILTAPYWGEMQGAMLWRPVTTLSFACDQRIGGGAVWWFHLINLILHATVTILWALLVRRLTGKAGLALVAGALFAVHPLHTEAVTWVSGRAELLAAGFGIAALHLAFSRAGRGRARWLAPLAILFAISSKESAATIPLVLVFLTVSFTPREERGRPSLGLLVACFVPILFYVVARRVVLGGWAGPLPDPMDNPMVSTGLIRRLPTVFECAGRYIALTLCPRASRSITRRRLSSSREP